MMFSFNIKASNDYNTGGTTRHDEKSDRAGQINLNVHAVRANITCVSHVKVFLTHADSVTIAIVAP